MHSLRSLQRGFLGLGLFALLATAAAAEAPSGHFALDGDVAEDTATKLVWQRATADSTYSFDDAKKYCAELGIQGGGWRMPTVKELQTLVDETRAKPAIDPNAFPDTVADYYWSGSPLASHTDNAWAVSFVFGYDNFFRLAEKQHVRCVR